MARVLSKKQPRDDSDSEHEDTSSQSSGDGSEQSDLSDQEEPIKKSTDRAERKRRNSKVVSTGRSSKDKERDKERLNGLLDAKAGKEYKIDDIEIKELDKKAKKINLKNEKKQEQIDKELAEFRAELLRRKAEKHKKGNSKKTTYLGKSGVTLQEVDK